MTDRKGSHMAAIANENIEKARTLLAEGRNKQASRTLTDAAVACRDEETAREIKAIAEEGIQGAGFLGKSQWKEVLRLAALRGA